MITLSLPAVRALLLSAQGLDKAPQVPTTKEAVLATIRCMGLLQIDTINIVARSPYFVLWSRLGSYEPRYLDELLAEGALFEYWAHAACFLPIEDFGLYRRQMLEQTPRSRAWLAAHPEEVERVLALVQTKGAVRAADFPRTEGRAGQWWDRKPEKNALENLFNTGSLMIARRENFQRVYDLQERVLPGWDDQQTPTQEEIYRQWVERSVRALGVAPVRWIADYFRLPKKGIPSLVEQLTEEGIMRKVKVDGWKEAAYVCADNLAVVEQAAAGELQPSYTTLLTPFDPIVWDRKRALELFDFDYRIEVYTPAAARRYGYFTLPILHDDALVGRVDPKAHRRQGIFEVIGIHLEDGVALTPHLVSELARTLHACAEWHQTPDVIIRKCEPPELQSLLQSELEQLKESATPAKTAGG